MMATVTSAAPSAQQSTATGRLFTWRTRQMLIAFLFILPAIINFTVFRYIPIAASIRASFYEYSLLRGLQDFIGFDHYVRMMSDDTFWKSLQVTSLFVIYKVPIQIVLSLALAVLLTQETFSAGVVRSAILTPMVTSVIVASIIWAMMYHSQLGLIQSFLGAIGIPPQAFLSDASRALPAVTVMMIWKDPGFSFIILLAGLKAIPQTYYEAALVDGANAWEAFRRITIPLLMPVLMFVVVTQAVFSFQVFVPVYQMTRGGPLDSTKVLVYYIYQQGFRFQDMGYASALSVVALIIMIVISYLLMRWLRPQT
jgi:multiple sugar transport system permease protein